MSPGFRVTDRRTTTRHPSPDLPPTSRSPRVVLCYERLANPDAHDSRRCYGNAGHDGKHEWETCPAEHDCDGVGGYGCERDKGHDGDHRVTIEW